jgi:L-rhamnose mutarotase
MTDATEWIAFRMLLRPGNAAEYRRRHAQIWPELAAILRAAGVLEYRIYLDESTNALFATLRRRSDHALEQLPQNDVVRRWWRMMADIMETEADATPVQQPLTEMFDLARAQ